MPESHKQPLLQSQPLKVDVIDGEIIVDGRGSPAPSLTATAARQTAKLLIEATEALEGGAKTQP